MDSSETIKKLIKQAIYQRRMNPKPKKPKKWNKAYRPFVNKKAPKVKKKETYGKKTPTTPDTPTTTTTVTKGAFLLTKIASLEIRLAFGHYAYKYLQDIIASGGRISIDQNSAPSLTNSVQKMLNAGYLEKESGGKGKVIYKLTRQGEEGVKDILADMDLRNPKTLKSLNRY